MYQVCRSGRRMSRRDAVDYVATRYRHGPANRPHLERALTEVEEELFGRVKDDPRDTSERIAALERELAELRGDVAA